MKRDQKIIPNIRLITERQYHHWSQQDVADRIGTTRNNVSRWERGTTSPDPYLRQRLCQLFEKSAEDLGLCSNKLKASVQVSIDQKMFEQSIQIHTHATVLSQFQQIEERYPVAAEVLQLCAFLAPHAIPEEVLTVGFFRCSEHVQALPTNHCLLNDAIAVLGNYSLLYRDSETKTLHLHRQVQAILQDRLSEQEQEKWLNRIVIALDLVFPEVESVTLKPEARKRCEQLMPHVLQCITHTAACNWGQANKVLAKLLFKAGMYLMAIWSGNPTERENFFAPISSLLSLWQPNFSGYR